MLSFLYQMATAYEKEHGKRPNRLYLNNGHFTQLRQSFRNPDDLDSILRTLDMELILDPEAVHPHVGWAEPHRSATG